MAVTEKNEAEPNPNHVKSQTSQYSSQKQPQNKKLP